MSPDLDEHGYLATRGSFVISGWTETDTDGTRMTYFRQQDLEKALDAFGEDEIAGRVRAGIPLDDVHAIGRRHAELMYTSDPATASGAGYPFDKALAMAAVEVLEAPRPLARKRRRAPR